MAELVGVWTLVSFERRSSNGDLSHPFGTSAVGQLIYDPSGRMSAALMAQDRPLLGMLPESVKGMRPSFKSLKVIARVFKASMLFSSYAGRYRLEGDTVVHQVEVSSLVDWVGTELRRHVSMDNGQLALGFTDALGNQVTLRWKRALE